jgi:hypothetical protein
MRKFIKGQFELDKNVEDLEEYEAKKINKIKEIVEWCNSFGVAIAMGTSEDNTYLCEYKIVARTKQMCNGLLKEMKDMLKATFPYVKLILQESGDCLY